MHTSRKPASAPMPVCCSGDRSAIAGLLPALKVLPALQVRLGAFRPVKSIIDKLHFRKQEYHLPHDKPAQLISVEVSVSSRTLWTPVLRKTGERAGLAMVAPWSGI